MSDPNPLVPTEARKNVILNFSLLKKRQNNFPKHLSTAVFSLFRVCIDFVENYIQVVISRISTVHVGFTQKKKKNDTVCVFVAIMWLIDIQT